MRVSDLREIVSDLRAHDLQEPQPAAELIEAEGVLSATCPCCGAEIEVRTELKAKA